MMGITGPRIGRSPNLPHYPDGVFGGEFGEGAWRSPLLTWLMQTSGRHAPTAASDVTQIMLTYDTKKSERRTFEIMPFREDFGSEPRPWVRATIRMREKIEHALLYSTSVEEGVRRGLLESAEVVRCPLPHSSGVDLMGEHFKGNGWQLWLCGADVWRSFRGRSDIRIADGPAAKLYRLRILLPESSNGAYALAVWEPAFSAIHRDAILVLNSNFVSLRHAGDEPVNLSRVFDPTSKKDVDFFDAALAVQNSGPVILWRTKP